MAITYSNAIQDFGNTLYRVIRWLEEKGGVLHQTVYTDGKGYATIGAGFLISKDNLPAILRNMGLAENLITQATTKIAAAVTLNGKPRSFSTDAAALQAISNALHEVSAGANFAYSNVTATSDAQIRQTFDDILPRYTGTVATFVANVSAANKPASNREYLALLSLAYNGMLGKNDKGNLISPSLQQALIDGDRAEAWFQIRYGSNPDNLPGFAKRRYFESSLFSLYADPSNPSDEEVKQAYRMLQLHRTKIVDYEKRHGYWTDTVGTVAGTTRDANGRLGLDAANGADYVGILGFLPRGHAEFAIEAFDPAKQRLFAMIPELSGFNPADYLATNIYLDPSRDRAVDPMTGSAVPVDNEHRGYLNATTYNSQGNEIASNDILIGEGGIDYLRGGKGDDILMGGTGRDVYLYKLGDGNDRIIDSDGGFLIISSATGASDSFQLYATGAFVKTGQDTWTRTEGQHTITLSHNSPWTLTLEDGATIDLGESFNPDSFGIDLVEATTGGTLIKGDLDPILDGNGDLQYDADGNVVVNAAIAAPGRIDTLHGTASADTIRALAGNDVIEAGGGSDLVEGGSGSDILGGQDGNDTVWAETALADASPLATALANGETDASQTTRGDWADGGGNDDILIGSAAQDLLTGGTDHDLLIGGAGDDLLLGDAALQQASTDWSVTRSVETGSIYHYQIDQGATTGSDTLGGADVLHGGKGADWAFAGAGDDMVDGGSDDDVLFGDAGNDVILGGSGADVINGDNANLPANLQGADWIDGGDGADRIWGMAGDDILIGGTGNDTIVGGAGRDTYFVSADGKDRIVDADRDSIVFIGDGVVPGQIKLRKGSLLLDFGNGAELHIDNFDHANPLLNPSFEAFQFADGTPAVLLGDGSTLGCEEPLTWGSSVQEKSRRWWDGGLRGRVGRIAKVGAGGTACNGMWRTAE